MKNLCKTPLAAQRLQAGPSVTPPQRGFHWLALALLGGLAGGCAAPDAQVLNANEPAAMQAALSRARVDLDCVRLGATAHSRQIADRSRAVYAIAVQGCGRQRDYTVVCPLGSRCSAEAAPPSADNAERNR